jgi:predicted nuclease with TOPRIM domain
MTGRVTVFPVPVDRKPAGDEADPARLTKELERLRGENAVLRERLASVQTIALEREETIEDLRHALQMLPSAWAEKLHEGREPDPGITDAAVATPENAVAPPEHPTSLGQTATASATTPGAKEQAEVLFAEIAALRARLERKRLEAEHEILEQERKRLLSEIEWTRRWQRSRRNRPATA